MLRIPSSSSTRLPPSPHHALVKFALCVISLSTAALLNLPMSPPEFPPWTIIIIVYSVIVYAAFIVGMSLLSVSLLRRTAPPSPSPNRRQTPPEDTVLRLAIWAMALSADGLFNLPTAKKETQFGEVLVMVYAVTMILAFNLGWVLLCLNLRNRGTDLSLYLSRCLIWVELSLATFSVALKISLAMVEAS